MSVPDPGPAAAEPEAAPAAFAPAFFNLFRAEAEVVARLTAMAEQMNDLPGFISAAVCRGLDGRRVVFTLRWGSLAGFAAARPGFAAQMQAIAALAEPEPVACEVAAAFAAPGEADGAALPIVI